MTTPIIVIFQSRLGRLLRRRSLRGLLGGTFLSLGRRHSLVGSLFVGVGGGVGSVGIAFGVLGVVVTSILLVGVFVGDIRVVVVVVVVAFTFAFPFPVLSRT